jgi:hypothetical protein
MSQSHVGESVYSAGQLARMWEKPVFLVQRLTSEGKVATDEHGRISNTSLRAHYEEHGTP